MGVFNDGRRASFGEFDFGPMFLERSVIDRNWGARIVDAGYGYLS